MAVRAALFASLLIGVLSAGCTAEEPDAAGMVVPDAADAGAAAASQDDMAPSATGSVSTKRLEGSWEFGYSVADQDNTMLGTNWPEHKALGDVTGVVVAMAWTAATPTADRLTLYVLHGDERFEASGASPLRLAFEGAAASGSYRMAAVGGQDPGAYVHQGVTFHVTTFEGLPFDPAFTASGP